MIEVLATGLIWGLGYTVGYWMGKLNEQSKQIAQDLQDLRDGVAVMERALTHNDDEVGRANP